MNSAITLSGDKTCKPFRINVAQKPNGFPYIRSSVNPRQLQRTGKKTCVPSIRDCIVKLRKWNNPKRSTLHTTWSLPFQKEGEPYSDYMHTQTWVILRRRRTLTNMTSRLNQSSLGRPPSHYLACMTRHWPQKL